MFTEDEMPEGWSLLNANESDPMNKELRREVCKGHVLFNKEVCAIARRHDRDDVLFSTKDTEFPLYCVHLTWSQESTPDWPYVTAFKSKSDFLHNWNKIFD